MPPQHLASSRPLGCVQGRSTSAKFAYYDTAALSSILVLAKRLPFQFFNVACYTTQLPYPFDTGACKETALPIFQRCIKYNTAALSF